MQSPSDIPLPSGLTAELRRLAIEAKAIESTRNALVGGFLFGADLGDLTVRLADDCTHLLVVSPAAAPTPQPPTNPQGE